MAGQKRAAELREGTGTALMALPRCSNPLHAHLPMELRPGHTGEQRFCGTWYRCQLCPSGVLFPSRELEAQLAGQKAEPTKKRKSICPKGHVTDTPLDEGCHYETGEVEQTEMGTIPLGCGEPVKPAQAVSP